MALSKKSDPRPSVKGLEMNPKWFINGLIKDNSLTLPEPWGLYGPPGLRAPPKSSCNSRPESQWATAAGPRSARTSLSLRPPLSSPEWLGKRSGQCGITEGACPPGSGLFPVQTLADFSRWSCSKKSSQWPRQAWTKVRVKDVFSFIRDLHSWLINHGWIKMLISLSCS